MKNKYGVDIPLALLLRAPTIAILADFLRDAGKQAHPSCIIPLNRSKTGPPIVLIPGLGGNILDLYELSVHLDKRFPCYGLQHPRDGENSGINASIEDLAGYYLHELEAVLSLEGCILLGHSFGGYVAYELARLLQRRGRRPQALILLDVVAPHGDPVDRRLSLTEHDLIRLTVGSLLGNREGAGEETPEGHESPGNEYEKALGVLKAANRLPRSLSVDGFRQTIETIARRAAAFSRYRPAFPIDTDITLYRAAEIDARQGFTQEDGNWTGFAGRSFTLQWAPGNHFTMIKGSHAAPLAERIHRAILRPDEARTG